MLLGYSQSFNLPIIQIADITGPYGVSFLIVLVNLGLYLTLRKAPKRFYILFFIFILVALTLAYGGYRLKRIYPEQKLAIWVPKSFNQVDVASKQSSIEKEHFVQTTYYTVKQGDTLWDIARKYNTTIEKIKNWNKKKNSNIKPGDRIIIKK